MKCCVDLDSRISIYASRLMGVFMKRTFGGLIILIGVCGLVGAGCAFAGMFEIPSRRGPIGLVAISCAFIYVGWNWLQNKVAE